MSIEKTLNEIEDLFDIFDDPKDKLSQLMDIAKDYDGIPEVQRTDCLLYTSPSPRDMRRSRMPSSA